jgi:homoserine kinase
MSYSNLSEHAFHTSDLRPPACFQVCVPASTSNLGAGFDCFGLALQLYLTVRATVVPNAKEPCRVRASRNEGGASLPRTTDNLIYRAMSFVAEKLDQKLPPVRLVVHNEIPLGRGLGSSAAAIIAGVKLCGLVCGCEITPESVLTYATELEGHADNVAPSLFGGWAITCTSDDGRVVALRKSWPTEVKVLIVSPDAHLETKRARAALPQEVSHTDAVYNLQRAALFTAAMEAGAYHLVWEAMQDQLHQKYRKLLTPGLADALATPRMEGLLGLALSGAGPSILALVQNNFEEIGAAIARPFHQQNISTAVRLLEVDEHGAREQGGRRKAEG